MRPPPGRVRLRGWRVAAALAAVACSGTLRVAPVQGGGGGGWSGVSLAAATHVQPPRWAAGAPPAAAAAAAGAGAARKAAHDGNRFQSSRDRTAAARQRESDSELLPVEEAGRPRGIMCTAGAACYYPGVQVHLADGGGMTACLDCLDPTMEGMYRA